MKRTAAEKLIKRSKAADLLGVASRTLKRWERLGLLDPIKPNCRAVLYREGQVHRIMNGQAETAASAAPRQTPRTKAGEFAPV